MINENILKSAERAVYELRSLYKSYGYQSFKMSKFEEYDLYVRNKEFLQGGGVITFSDTGGELLALKPDVTLSIIKNTTDAPGTVSKLCYDENVYRISGATHRFKEIMQTGIECIGELDSYSVYEVLYLAAKSLSLISERFVLDISHMGLVKAVIDSVTDDEQLANELIKMLSQKNKHETEALLLERGVCPSAIERLNALISVHGKPSEVIERLAPLCDTAEAKIALSELAALGELLGSSEFSEKINFDFSVINNMSYYNGIVFKGFIEGIPEGVLAGGRYGALMKRMDRRSDAIGFAIYLDLLEELSASYEFDVDVLLIYESTDDVQTVKAAVDKLLSCGKSVTAQTAVPEKLRYRELIKL